MNSPFNAAAAAYGNAARLLSQTGKGGLEPAVGLTSGDIGGVGTGSEFAKMLAENVQSVVDTGATSDRLAFDMVNGKANVVDVVTAISETEIAMESMVTIRDKVISAYEEIMRMQI